MKIIVAPDKFKGSLTSFEACKAISDGIRKANEKTEIIEFPMADGGDGFSAVLQRYLKTDTVVCDTLDPLGRKITAVYQWDEKNKIAIIEMAVASGLVLLNEEERNPLLTSTFGTGLLIKHAIERGAKKIILGLGGSATNDGGTGILSALGFQLISKSGSLLQASGENLLAIQKIIPAPFIPSVKFEIACDVQNVLYGHQGAAYIYAPQKGADKEQVEFLDKGLKNLADILKEQTGKDISKIPGTGAAGGIAACLLSFFDVNMKKGIELITEAGDIENEISGADLIITGEGKIDDQSGEGKVVGYIAALAKKYGVPCIGLCGITELDKTGSKKMGLKKIIALQDGSVTNKEAMNNAAALLQEKAAAIFTFL
ncbi:MAG: glycerate kinase [Chitinophagaceae bacterium]